MIKIILPPTHTRSLPEGYKIDVPEHLRDPLPGALGSLSAADRERLLARQQHERTALLAHVVQHGFAHQ